MRNGAISLIVLVGLLLAACGKPAPQIPSQRKSSAPTVDSAALALMELNQQLAMTADQQLAQFAQTQEEPYALYEANTWMYISERGDTDSPSPAPEEEWTVHMRTYTLAGELLIDTEGSYRIGKCELPQAVDANMSELHHGAKVRLLAPWYSAYGLHGTDAVPPYENVIIELELK